MSRAIASPPEINRCDIFCRIIDNYGDIGVCWRLARQLHREHGLAVTLWVDDLPVFARLAPALDTQAAHQTLDGIAIHQLDSLDDTTVPGQLVIEGFGCPLPPAFLAAMTQQQPAPVWLNLEYLSAEAWVEDCHGLASPHPANGLVQHFWFPGFTPRTGGLLRESGLLAARDSFQEDSNQQAAFWQRLGLPDALSFDRRLSLFAYENPAISGLLDALATASQPTLLVVPEGRALTEVAAWAGERLLIEKRYQKDALTIATLPLLPHEDYDRLLWACDLNLVRGEDSFVRAQWAGRPFLWHIYPQDEQTHLVKLNAFIHLFEAQAPVPAAWQEAMRHWNTPSTTDSTGFDWSSLLENLPLLTRQTRYWASYRAQQPDLATQMMHFLLRQVE